MATVRVDRKIDLPGTQGRPLVPGITHEIPDAMLDEIGVKAWINAGWMVVVEGSAKKRNGSRKAKTDDGGESILPESRAQRLASEAAEAEASKKEPEVE